MKMIISSIFILFIASCASPITREETQNLSYNCSNVDEKISILLEEKAKNNRRILNGVRSVLPVSAVVNLIRGQYKENSAIATGEWAKVLDKKIAEMKTHQSQC